MGVISIDVESAKDAYDKYLVRRLSFLFNGRAYIAYGSGSNRDFGLMNAVLDESKLIHNALKP